MMDMPTDTQADCLSVLQEVFGYDAFRGPQADIVGGETGWEIRGEAGNDPLNGSAWASVAGGIHKNQPAGGLHGFQQDHAAGASIQAFHALWKWPSSLQIADHVHAYALVTEQEVADAED
ncbi:MAG: hypothetical protein Q8N06_18145 [Hydrogenophaga sp.]|nr:hypothetical protein [Hydrogenophaga sp.]